MALLPEDSIIKKQDRFQRDLTEFIRQRQPDNRDVYQFVLENGFLPSHAGAVLRGMQASGNLSVVEIGSGQKARGNAFYVNWNEYNSGQPRVRFSLKGTPNVV